MTRKNTVLVAVLSLLAAILIVTMGVVIWREFSREELELPEVSETIQMYGDMMLITNPSNCSVNNGETAEFSVVVSGEKLTYQWQKSEDGENWQNSSSEGADTANLVVTAKTAFNDLQFRCSITNNTTGDTIYSESAKLTVIVDGPAIKSQPKDCKAKVGEEATLSVNAYGDGLTYQWQKSSDGKSWTDCSSDSSNSSTFTLIMKESYTKLVFRCVITDADGKTVTTRTAKLKK